MFSDDGLVDIALNQRIPWKKRMEMDPYGAVSFFEPVEIACRVSTKNRITINQNGEQVTSGSMITTKAAVEIGDKLTIDGLDLIVINVSRPATFDGTEHRRKVFV